MFKKKNLKKSGLKEFIEETENDNNQNGQSQ